MPLFDLSQILMTMQENCKNAGLQVEEVSLPSDPPQRLGVPPPVVTITLGGDSLPVSEAMGQDDVWSYPVAVSCWISPYAAENPISGEEGALSVLSTAFTACEAVEGRFGVIRVIGARLSIPQRVETEEAAMDVVRLLIQVDVQPDMSG